MRFVSCSCLRDGMVLGKTLFGKKGEILLTEKTVINNKYIRKIRELGYNGLYIEDDLSKEIFQVNVINDSLRNKAVQSIKNTFIDIKKINKTGVKFTEDTPLNSKVNYNSQQQMQFLVEDMVNNLTENPNIMVNMVDLKMFNDYTFYHSVNVTILSIVLGMALHLDKEELYKLGMSALLHDIGKIFVPLEILDKPGKLTSEEFDIIKTHSEKGYRYLKDYYYDIPIKSYVGVLQHHEKFDGTGYPYNKRGEDISLFGRIISIADVYDALTSKRPYRNAMLPSDTMEYIMGGSSTLFDPKLVYLFTRKVAPYPLGTIVELSNNAVGIVLENFEYCCTRPKLKIIRENNIEVEPYMVDLSLEHFDTTIIKVLEL